jgi:hypothetical protein
MTPKEKEKDEKIANLEKELQKVSEQRDGLLKRVQELEAEKPASKSKQQALQALEMLKAGPVTQAMLKGLNAKYPSDPVYYVRTQLKVNVHTVRTAAGTVYMTDEIFKTYQEGLAKEKAAADAAKAAAKAEATPKEAPRQASTQVSPTVAAGAAKAGARAAAVA